MAALSNLLLLFANSLLAKLGYSGTVIDDNSVGTVAWTNPTRAQGNQTTLFALWTAGGNNIISHYLNAQNFGFAIPSSAKIKGIKLDIYRKGNGLAAINDKAISLIKGGAISGTVKTLATAWSSTANYFSYGGKSDLWGQSWTPADINASNFGAAISILGASKLAQANLYQFRITVYYQ